MSTYYSSLSLPADRHEVVARRVDAWLEAKGFAKLDEPVLFDDLDREHERGVALLWTGRWTVLLHSEAREDERLRFELGGLDAPLLHLWCHDVDGWGYTLYVEGVAVSGWASDPSRRGDAGDDDLEALARGVGGIDPAALRRARRGRPSVDADAEAFASALGAPIAASGYPGPRTLDGATIERWLYRRRDHDPMAGFDLHATPATATAPPPHANDWSALAEAIGVAEARRLRRLTVVARWLSGFMRVLKTPWVLAHRAHLALRHRRRAASLRQAFRSATSHPGLHRAPTSSDLRVETRALFNQRHGIGVRWGADADVAPADVSGVLPLRVGVTPVVCRALRGGMATRMLTRRVGVIEAEEDYAGGLDGTLAAKRVRSRLPQVDPPLLLEEHYVQTPQAVYVFGVGPAADLEDDLPALLRSLVEGLAVDAVVDDGDRRSAGNASRDEVSAC
ncbi:MAG: hypothetical protein AAGE94_13820 [Acidobacteriota bacterium]